MEILNRAFAKLLEPNRKVAKKMKTAVKKSKKIASRYHMTHHLEGVSHPPTK